MWPTRSGCSSWTHPSKPPWPNSELSVGHAKVLLGLQLEAERQSLATTIINEGLSVRKRTASVSSKAGTSPRPPAASRKTKPPPPPPARHRLGFFEASLSQRLETPVHFKHGTADQEDHNRLQGHGRPGADHGRAGVGVRSILGTGPARTPSIYFPLTRMFRYHTSSPWCWITMCPLDSPAVAATS